MIFFLAIGAAAAVGVLYAIACQVRNHTDVSDLKVRVESMRADYEQRQKAAKAGEEIIAEVVGEGTAA